VAQLQKLRDLDAQAQALAEKAVALNEAAQAERLSSMAKRKARTLDPVKIAADGIDKETRQLAKDSESGVRRVEEIMTKAVKDREAAAASRADQERRQREEEEQRKQAEALAPATKEEIGQAEGLHVEHIGKVKPHAFDEALKALEAKQADFKTDGGKAAFKVVVERFQRMEALRTFLIEQLNAHPFSWGWIQSRSQEDVLGADAQGIKLKSSVVPWNQVTTQQMLHFIRKYVPNRDLPVRVQADMNLAAAIYCFELGGTDAAIKFADRAIELRPNVEEDVKRMLPNLRKKAEDAPATPAP
jgi:hypothetical protein